MNVQLPEATTVIGDPQTYTLIKIVTVRYETTDPAARMFLPPPQETRETVTFTVRPVTETRYALPDATQPTTPVLVPFLDESWRDTGIYKPDLAPKLPLVWCYGDDPTPANVAAKTLPDELFGYALELAIQSPQWGTTYGIRVFPTRETRWEIFQPYADQETWMGVPLRFLTPLKLHNSGGGGEWFTGGLQIKDGVSKNALFQMNWKPEPDGRVRLWCEMPYGAAREVTPFFLPAANTPLVAVLRYQWAKDSAGSFDLFMNGSLVSTGRGRTGHEQSGFGNASLTIYGNMIDAPIILRAGAFQASTASLL